MQCTGFKNGCGQYWRLISDGTSAPSFTELQKKFQEATAHREKCPECYRLNTPLEQQLFSTAVKVIDDYPYYWRVKKYLPGRFGQPCRELARGKLRSCLLEFQDGYKVRTDWRFRSKRKEIDVA